MSFDWNKLLDVAHYLSSASPSALDPEARCRSVINRAYYCAYHLATEYAEQNLGFQVTHTGSDHADVVHCFSQSTSLSPQKKALITESLKRLRKKRRQADYYKDISSNKRKAQAAMRDAQSILAEIT